MDLWQEKKENPWQVITQEPNVIRTPRTDQLNLIPGVSNWYSLPWTLHSTSVTQPATWIVSADWSVALVARLSIGSNQAFSAWASFKDLGIPSLVLYHYIWLYCIPRIYWHWNVSDFTLARCHSRGPWASSLLLSYGIFLPQKEAALFTLWTLHALFIYYYYYFFKGRVWAKTQNVAGIWFSLFLASCFSLEVSFFLAEVWRQQLDIRVLAVIWPIFSISCL